MTFKIIDKITKNNILMISRRAKMVCTFKCPRCGTIKVVEERFRRHLSESEWLKLQEQKKSGAVEFRIEFQRTCPHCSPNAKGWKGKPVALYFSSLTEKSPSHLF